MFKREFIPSNVSEELFELVGRIHAVEDFLRSCKDDEYVKTQHVAAILGIDLTDKE